MATVLLSKPTNTVYGIQISPHSSAVPRVLGSSRLARAAYQPGPTYARSHSLPVVRVPLRLNTEDIHDH